MFIVFATVLSFLLGLWALMRGIADASGVMMGIGLIALVSGIILVLYGVTFWRKIKHFT